MSIHARYNIISLSSYLAPIECVSVELLIFIGSANVFPLSVVLDEEVSFSVIPADYIFIIFTCCH
jgi:hypothetical protein